MRINNLKRNDNIEENHRVRGIGTNSFSLTISQMNSPDLNQVDYSTCEALQWIYRQKIHAWRT